MRALKAAFGALVIVGLLVFSAVAASARDPIPGQFVFTTDATGHQISSSSPDGYTSPPASYKVGDTLSYNFNLNNHGVPPEWTDHSTAHDVFQWKIFRLGLDGSQNFTEAELEAKVHEGHDGGQTLVHGPENRLIDLPNATTVPVTFSTTLTAAMVPAGCGYFQFDFRLVLSEGTVNTGAALNSGFFRVMPCAAAGVSPVQTTPPASSGAGGAAILAGTGGGAPADVPWYVLALLGSLMIVLGARMGFRKVS